MNRRAELFWRLALAPLGAVTLALLVLASLLFFAQSNIRQEHSRQAATTAQHALSLPSRPAPAEAGEPLEYLPLVTEFGRGMVVHRSVLTQLRLDPSRPMTPQPLNPQTPPVLPVGNQMQSPRLRPEEVQAMRQAANALTERALQRATTTDAGLYRYVDDSASGLGLAVTFLPLGVGPTIEHVVLVLQPQAYFDRMLSGAWRWMALAAVVALTMVAAAAWAMAQQMGHAFSEVERVAHLAAAGDLSQRAPTDQTGPLGAVAKGLNQALDSLAALRSRQQEMDWSRRELLADVSHEFRAPLATLRGYLELLEDGVIRPEEQGRYVGSMLKDTLRMSRLVEDLLDLARLESGQTDLKPMALDSCEACEQSLEQFFGRATRAGVTLVADLPAALPAVLADPSRLDQVMSNLLENAIRHAGEGGCVTLRAEESDGHLRITVTDTGPGISPTEQERVWQRFYKADKARTPGGGAGLGLAITRQLVLAMGGNVGLHSEPGCGATFWFALPLADRAVAQRHLALLTDSSP